MCGIAGYVRNRVETRALGPLVHTLRAIGHRGPDDEGLTVINRQARSYRDFATDQSASGTGYDRLDPGHAMDHDVALGHRRFSIVDLSIAGHQPLWTPDRKVCVSVNGEVFNHRELRAELETLGWSFNSTSDTELLAIAYQQWGTDCFQRFNGFWALSLYDAERNQVLLARDRLGKAPLYFACAADGVYWASEVNAVRDLAPGSFDVRDQSVVDFASWQRRDYYHTTFFEGIQTLPNATYAWIRSDGTLDQTRFWQVPTERMDASALSPQDAAGELRSLLSDAVRLRLQADVPASVQVSGGMDSSSVLALAAQEADQVTAFTVRFPGSSVDEEPFARMVAERYKSNVDYVVFEPPDSDLLDAIDSFVGLMGEPFHSPNLYTANGIWKVIADKGFRVNLYGSGGDEVLAGYSKDYYYPYLRHLATNGRIRQAVHELRSFSERGPGPFGIDYFLRAARSLPYGQQLSWALKDRQLRKIDPFVSPEGLRPRRGPAEAIEERMIDLVSDQLLNYWLRIDSQSSMSIPLELRNPFLDYRIVEYCFRLPLEYLMRDGWMKWILREAMDKDLPTDVTWRRNKAGFPFPLQDWLLTHEQRFLAMLTPLDCPYIDNKGLHDNWKALANGNPHRLWGLVSLALWWKKVIQGDQLEAA